MNDEQDSTTKGLCFYTKLVLKISGKEQLLSSVLLKSISKVYFILCIVETIFKEVSWKIQGGKTIQKMWDTSTAADHWSGFIGLVFLSLIYPTKHRLSLSKATTFQAV